MKHTIVETVRLGIQRYGIIIFFIGLQIFLVGSLWTFSLTDPSWFYHTNNISSYKNVFGFLGSNCAAWLIYCMGRAAFLSVFVWVYFLFLYFGISFTSKITFKTEWDRFLGVMIGFVTTAALCQVYQVPSYDFSYPGGVVGHYITNHLLISFDLIAQKIIMWAMFLCSTILVSRCSYLPALMYCCNRQNLPARIVIAISHFIGKFLFYVGVVCGKTWNVLTGVALRKIDSSIVEFEREENVDKDIERVVQDLFWHDYIDLPKKAIAAKEYLEQDEFPLQDNFVEVKDPVLDFESEYVAHENDTIDAQALHASRERQEQKLTDRMPKKNKYDLPILPVKKIEQKLVLEKQEILASQAKLLEEKLEQFDIKGTVVGMHSGPVVTLFEYQPDIKVKVSRILALEDDLAMALQALSIRIIAPIPGRSVVGFEVANRDRHDVLMARILQTPEFKNHSGSLPMIFGQDTLGNDIIADLAKMPHLLIAGSTGSGKSVALNAMLVSLLCYLKPDQLKLIIIDPKRLEFAAYDGIAHLIFPIITETKKAIPVLKWVVQEMENRYEIMAKHGVRNLLEYQTASKSNQEMEPMPLIVVIIDELADLMMTAGKAVEDSIARIAQMARAAGIHMIIATQRPSVDVITGMIKVNFPNRVAFKVTSKIDSRTILDVGGAEKLLGRGDMLFLDGSKSHLVRVHGAYISDQEIHGVVEQIKKQQKVQYLDIFQQFGSHREDELLDGDDELYEEVVELLNELDEVSISMLQRRFRIGYNRSARIISILESKGLIMSSDGGKSRRVVK